MKPTFFERLIAYMLDIFLVGLIASIICYNLPVNTTKYTEKLTDINEKYLSNEITEETYIQEYSDILYENQKSNIISLSVTTALTIGYFVVFQYMNNGQTLGKKLLHLRVVDANTQKPISIPRGLIRSAFILNIFSGTLNIIFIYTLSKNSYFISYGAVYLIEWLFIVVTVFFVIYRKDGRGLHDIMTNSLVIKERRW